MRPSIHLPVLMLMLMGWGAPAALGEGTGTGTSDSGTGRQQTDYGFSASSAVSVETPDHAFVLLSAGLQVLQAAENGVVLLRDDQYYYRWSAGTLTRLHAFYDGMIRFEGDRVTQESTVADMNARGTIAINRQWLSFSPVSGGLQEDDYIDVWTSRATQPTTYRPEPFAPVEPDGTSPISEAMAILKAVDDTDTLWVFTHIQQSNAQPNPYLITGMAQVSLEGAVTPFLPGIDYVCFGVSRSGIPIGSASDGIGTVHYYVGTREVDFVPDVLNDNGVVIGHGTDGSAKFIWYPDGHTEPLPDDGEVTSLDRQNRPHGVDRATGAPVLWVKKLDAEGQPLAPIQYDRVDYVPLAAPTGWSTAELVPPGVRSVTAGLVARSVGGQTETRPFLAIPATLRTDVNRDGVIDTGDDPAGPDRELFEKQLPYFFWVNDDDDEGETDGVDIPGQPADRADGNNAKVDGTRDLEDFFPVHLDLKRLLDVLSPDSGVTYKLAQADGALGCVLTNLTPANAGDYLRDGPTAIALAGAAVTRIPPEGVTLPVDFLNRIRTGDQGVVLIEASAPTTAPLAVEVWKGAEKLATLELPLSVAGVEGMFRHVNLCGGAGRKPETMSRGGVSNWDDRLSSDKVLLFLHGYNVDQQEARGFHSEMFKRLWWSGSRARFWGVTWFGYESRCKIDLVKVTPDYHTNVINALVTAPQLASFVAALRADGASDVSIAAHSLGNMVVAGAIADHGMLVKNFFMIQGAVAAEAFDAAEVQEPDGNATMPHTEWNRERGGVYPSRLWAAQWHECFPAGDARRTLTWYDRFSELHGAVVYDFYSTGDEVLEEHTANTPATGTVVLGQIAAFLRHLFGSILPYGRYAWAYQEKYKGRTWTDSFFGSSFGGWGFNQFDFRKAPGAVPGTGPALVPEAMTPQQAAGTDVFTDEVLREIPFFDPGDDGHEIASWVPANDGRGTYVVQRGSLDSLYGAGGSEFAARHRNTLLARMIPAMSLAAGRQVLRILGDPVDRYNFDMNAMKNGWPAERQGSDDTKDRWQHGDLRDVAYLYTYKFPEKLVELGDLRQ